MKELSQHERYIKLAEKDLDTFKEGTKDLKSVRKWLCISSNSFLSYACYAGNLPIIKHLVEDHAMSLINDGVGSRGYPAAIRCIFGMRYKDNYEALKYIIEKSGNKALDLNGKSPMYHWNRHKEYFVEQSGDVEKLLK